jgi:MFS family permease
MPTRDFYGWKLLSVLWGVVFINLAFPMYGSSVINTAMMSDLNLDRRTLGFVFSLYTIMSGLPGPLVAICVDRFGIRFTLILGSLLVAIGSVLMATVVSTGLHAALAFGIIVGVGVATGSMIAAQAGLARWFVRRRALALAIVYTASGVGGFLAAPLLNRVMASANGDWRMGWWFISGLSCFAGLIALAFVKEKPEDLGQLPDGGALAAPEPARSGVRPWRGAVHRTTEIWSYRGALSGTGFWLLMLCQLGMSCGYTSYLAHGIVHLQDLGHTRDAGSWAISLIALSGLISKGIFGALGDRIDPRYLWAVFVGVFGVGQFLAVQAGTLWIMVGVSICLGIGFGGGVVCMAAVLSNYYGINLFAALAGLAVAINTTLSSITPSIAGWLYDRGHGYHGVFYTLGIWCVAAAFTLFAMKPPAKRMVRPA